MRKGFAYAQKDLVQSFTGGVAVISVALAIGCITDNLAWAIQASVFAIFVWTVGFIYTLYSERKELKQNGVDHDF